MGEDLRTKSGLKPDDTGVPFSVTTNQVEKYLQQRVDAVCQSAKLNNVEIKVYTTEPGKYFCPFVVVLPTTVLQNPNAASEDNEPSIFTPNRNDDKKTRLKGDLYHLFKSYIYNESDAKAFFSSDWRNRTGVRSDAAPALKKLRVPIVNRIDGVEVVMFLLDPIKVFHDMLRYSNDNRPYKINITTLKKVRSGEFVYGIERSITSNKGNKKYKDVLINEINKKLRGGR
jgi:hypothetical protein